MLVSKSSLRRRLQIVELVRKRGEVSVEELSQVFDVSSVTIRTDLTYLEQQRYLVRSFGKARYLSQRPGDNVLAPIADSATRKASETTIARFAAEAGLLSSCASPAESLPREASRSRCCSTRVISRTRSDMNPTRRAVNSGIFRISSGNKEAGNFSIRPPATA